MAAKQKISKRRPTPSEYLYPFVWSSYIDNGRLSREQREEMYKLARERIFGSSEENSTGMFSNAI